MRKLTRKVHLKVLLTFLAAEKRKEMQLVLRDLFRFF